MTSAAGVAGEEDGPEPEVSAEKWTRLDGQDSAVSGKKAELCGEEAAAPGETRLWEAGLEPAASSVLPMSGQVLSGSDPVQPVSSSWGRS